VASATDPTKVLVIDDDPPIRLLCRVNLEAEGMEVLEAVDGAAGLELARTAHPDVILLDVTLPGLDGWEVAAQLASDERTRSAAIVFLSGHAELRERARELRLGDVAFVMKPFDPAELVATVREVAGR
jgi:DNA-binding response OmpR family regulator